VSEGRRALLAVGFLAAALLSTFPGGPAEASTQRRAVLIVEPPTSFPTFMRQPLFRQIARAGGAGLLATPVSDRPDARRALQVLLSGGSSAAGDRDLLIRALRSAGVPVCVVATATDRPCAGPGLAIWEPGAGTRGVPVRAGVPAPASLLVIALAPSPSAEMDRAGDEVTPIVVGQATAQGRFAANGPMHALTSDTTRYPGLVSNVDVAPTILAFFGAAVPPAMDGSPIRATGEAAPFGLYRKQVELRRIRFPIQIALLIAISVPGAAVILGLAAIGLRKRMAPAAAGWIRMLILSGVAFVLAVAAGGLLPRPTYLWVAAFLLVATGGLALLARIVPWRGIMAPLVFLGAAGLVYLMVDMAVGSRGLRVPLLGGTMFDGVRLYGLPNAFESMLLASGLFVASRFDPVRGALLLGGCGLLAGFPGLGADVGGSIVLFSAAGLWWQLRTRGRLGPREIAVAILVTVLGLAVVLVANRFLPGSPTHVTRFVESTGSRPASGLGSILHRFAANVGQLARTPGALVPLAGLLVALWAGVRGPEPIVRGLAAAPGWRDVLVVLVLSSGVALVVNDTGLSAAAPAFVYAVAVVAYPVLSLAARPSEVSRV
jgi:hypothetical protein